jgi:hypothetical protein
VLEDLSDFITDQIIARYPALAKQSSYREMEDAFKSPRAIAGAGSQPKQNVRRHYRQKSLRSFKWYPKTEN